MSTPTVHGEKDKPGYIVKQNSVVMGVCREGIRPSHTGLESYLYLEPTRETPRSRSKYKPHQGAAECARRIKQGYHV